jgi:peroxiredoxin
MQFTFPLLCDPSREAGRVMGVLREPGSPGADWARRITYVVDSDAIVRLAYRVKDAAGHPEDVVNDVRALVQRRTEIDPR